MAGLATITDEWAVGINDQSLKKGLILNPNYTTSNGQPQYYFGDVSLKYTADSTDIKNYIKALALLGVGSTLQREVLDSHGGDTYNLKQKASDIKYCARYMDGKVGAVTSTTIFAFDAAKSASLVFYQSRMAANALSGQMVCQITKVSDGTEYIRVFTISGTTITLTTAVSGLAAGDRFELISCYDILKNGVEQATGLPSSNKAYVIKSVDPMGQSSIKFSAYDKPNISHVNAQEKVVIYYNPLSDYQPKLIFDESINRYDISTSTEDLSSLPLTAAQLEVLYNEFNKFIIPLETITLTTYRPGIPEVGWSIPVNITNVTTGSFNIISVNYRWIHSVGQKAGKPFLQTTITLASYINKIGQILASMKTVSGLASIKTDPFIQYRDITELKYTFECIDTTQTTTPTGLAYNSYNPNGFNLTWTAVSGASNYRVDLSLNSDFTLFLGGYANFNTTTNSLGINGADVRAAILLGSTIYARVRANSGTTGLSANSTTLLITNPVTYEFTETAYTVLYVRFKEGSGTTLEDES